MDVGPAGAGKSYRRLNETASTQLVFEKRSSPSPWSKVALRAKTTTALSSCFVLTSEECRRSTNARFPDAAARVIEAQLSRAALMTQDRNAPFFDRVHHVIERNAA